MLTDSQLHWRCRRGVRELDVLFTRFVKEHYPGLQESQQETFQRMLDVQDPEIMDWLFGKTHPNDKDMRQLVDYLKEISGL